MLTIALSKGRLADQTLDLMEKAVGAYTPEQIVQYARDTYSLTISQEIEIIADICETPGEVNLLLDNGVISLYDYVTLVADNIAECSGSNAFKIEDKIALKDEPDKYDLRLFWKAFMKVCSDRMRSEVTGWNPGLS